MRVGVAWLCALGLSACGGKQPAAPQVSAPPPSAAVVAEPIVEPPPVLRHVAAVDTRGGMPAFVATVDGACPYHDYELALGVCANVDVPETLRPALIAEYRRGLPPPVLHDHHLDGAPGSEAPAGDEAPSERADVDPSKLDPSALLSTPEQEEHNVQVGWKQPYLDRQALDDLQQRQYRSRMREYEAQRERARERWRSTSEPNRFEQQRINNDRAFEQAKRDAHVQRW